MQSQRGMLSVLVYAWCPLSERLGPKARVEAELQVQLRTRCMYEQALAARLNSKAVHGNYYVWQ
jgi:hypothetical protein